MTNYTTLEQVTSTMSISEYSNDSARDVVKAIRATIAARVMADGVPDIETRVKFAKQAVSAFTTAYEATSLTASAEKTLLERTGLRYENVQQFGIVDYRVMLANMKAWGLKAAKGSKKAVKADTSKELAKVRALMPELNIGQQLRAAGLMKGDKITYVIGDTVDTFNINREGKIQHALADQLTNEVKTVSAKEAGNYSKSAMLEGRARRIARELKAAGGDKGKLGKSDAAWISKNKEYFNAYLTKSEQPALGGLSYPGQAFAEMKPKSAEEIAEIRARYRITVDDEE